MKKLFTLLMLMVCSIGAAWAADETEKSPTSGSSNVSVAGKSYTLDGKYVAGNGANMNGSMVNKGLKLRTNQSNVIVFEVNAGYTIKSIKAAGYTNADKADVEITGVTVDDGTTNLLASSITLPGKSTGKADGFAITGITATKNIILTFGTNAGKQIMLAYEITYEKGEVPVQEIKSVNIGNYSLTEENLNGLKEGRRISLSASVLGLNGVPGLSVELSSGTTNVSRAIDGDKVSYAFTINETETYTVDVIGIGKTYTQNGAVASTTNMTSGKDTPTLTFNEFVFNMVNTEKLFNAGTGKVTLGDNAYNSIKLSTGSAVNVTLQEGKVATKLIVYGWSASGNGKLTVLSESQGSEKAVDVSNDIFYSFDTANDIYPSVYEYDLDNWSSIYFDAGGSASQPFIVFDIVLEDAQPANQSISISDAKYATCVTKSNLDFTGTDVTAYTVSAVGETTITLAKAEKVAAGQAVIVSAAAGGTYEIPTTTEEVSAVVNKMEFSDADTEVTEANTYYVVANGANGVGFYPVNVNTTIAAGKGFVKVEANNAKGFMGFGFDGETTGISEVKTAGSKAGEIYNLNGQRVAAPAKGLYIMNGKKVVIK